MVRVGPHARVQCKMGSRPGRGRGTLARRLVSGELRRRCSEAAAAGGPGRVISPALPTGRGRWGSYQLNDTWPSARLEIRSPPKDCQCSSSKRFETSTPNSRLSVIW